MELNKTLESPLDCKEIKLVLIKEINPDYSLEGLVLKLHYFVTLMPRVGVFKKTQMLGKTEGKKQKGHKKMRWLESITDSTDMNLSWVWETVKTGELGGLQSTGSQRAGQNLATEQDYTLNMKYVCIYAHMHIYIQ